MTVPGWWNERRYGMFVHSNIATVPSFARSASTPTGTGAISAPDRARGRAAAPVVPLAEVLAYHRDRWSHVERFDDFIPFLTYHRFDADEHLELAVDGGHEVPRARHQAPRRLLLVGRARDRRARRCCRARSRNVVAELAEACRRNGVLFGTYYSLLDWGDPALSGCRAYVDEVLHPHVLDLVERYGSQILWGDGHWGHGPDVWRSKELIEQRPRSRRRAGLELRRQRPLVAPATRTSRRSSTTRPTTSASIRGSCAAASVTRSATTAPSGPSTCSRRARCSTCSPRSIAKGGNLLLNVGPAVDGTIPDLQQAPLPRRRRVGERARSTSIHGSRPFDQWGDAQVRYVHASASERASRDRSRRRRRDHARRAHADATRWSRSRPTMAARCTGSSTAAASASAASTVRRPDWPASTASGCARRRETIQLFDERVSLTAAAATAARRHAARRRCRAARRGSLPRPGRRCPRASRVRGMGWDRTTIVGDGQTAVHLQAASTARARPRHRRTAPLLELPRACRHGARRRARRWSGAVVTATSSSRADDVAVLVRHRRRRHRIAVIALTVERCALKGMRWDVGIDITARHRAIECTATRSSNTCATSGSPMRPPSEVSENRLEGRWWGVHLRRCDHIEVVRQHHAPHDACRRRRGRSRLHRYRQLGRRRRQRRARRVRRDRDDRRRQPRRALPGRASSSGTRPRRASARTRSSTCTRKSPLSSAQTSTPAERSRRPRSCGAWRSVRRRRSSRWASRQGIASIADAFVGLSLAGSLFFNLSPDASREQVLLYLLVTISPLAVLAPLIGPTVDRFRNHRRIRRRQLLRAASPVLPADGVHAVSALVLRLRARPADRRQGVGHRQAGADPDARRPIPTSSCRRNARLSRTGSIIGAIGGSIGVAAAALGRGPRAAPRRGGRVPVLEPGRSPGRCRSSRSRPTTCRRRSSTPRPTRRRSLLGSIGFMAIRAAVGFFVFTLAFTLRRASEPTWVYGAAVVIYGAGAVVGNLVAPILRRRFDEQRLIALALAAPTVPTVFGVLGVSRPLLVHRSRR